MPYTVFYAWQMDRDKRINRWFIHSAAKDAIAAVLSDSKLEDAPAIEGGEDGEAGVEAGGAEIRLDEGTQGEPGTSLIAETILKKIANCGVFLADVTIVGNTDTFDGRVKKMPNSNVMIELGAAIKSVGWGRIILVMNRAFGSAEDLPFDLKHRAIKVGYDLCEASHLEKGKKLKALTSEIADRLREIHQNGVVTREDQEKRKAMKEAESLRLKEVETERASFEELVNRNEYAGLKADAVVLALSIIPATRVRLDFPRSQEMAIRELVQPIHSDGFPVRVEPQSVIARDRHPENGIYTEVAELKESGTMFCVWNVMRWTDSFTRRPGIPQVDINRPWALGIGADYYEGFDLVVNRWLFQRLAGLKKLGVAGGWYVGISLLKTRNCVLMPTRHFTMDPEKSNKRDDMKGETVLVPADMDLAAADGFNTLLRRSWKQIWRHCAWNGVPRLNSNKEFVWEE